MSQTDSGINYADFAPLDSEGNIDSDTLGCHRGFCSDLNLKKGSLPPGWVPYWVNTRHEGMRIRAESQGWIPAHQVSQTIERDAPSNPNNAGMPLDSAHRRGDVTLYAMPIDQYRRLRAHYEEEARKARADVGLEYEKGPESQHLQDRFGGGHDGVPIRFRARGHGFQRG